ncbi:hypothetical protein OEW28_15570 [Defluviimonas sp. WL0002]|uniref:Uncharacterized protein n=1 Tax=Albidovulum marisflavi TaxID=2984159 RepID=A0ABT2ZFZ0_9RHOB|nr:hypothetical protein [Defluviimonas sp. WL0002]MCV2870050.1 hypothetical protein [Defluviimonas sp. WL0002]
MSLRKQKTIITITRPSAIFGFLILPAPVAVPMRCGCYGLDLAARFGGGKGNCGKIMSFRPVAIENFGNNPEAASAEHRAKYGLICRNYPYLNDKLLQEARWSRR